MAPSTSSEAEPSSGWGASIWDTLTSEPNTGVTVCSGDGQVLYANEQSARMFAGQDAKAADFIGANVTELAPPEYALERLKLFSAIRESGKPRLVRIIWRGWQHYSWIDPIKSTGDDDEPHGRFLIITRRIPRDEFIEQFAEGDHEVVESDVVELGPLDVLSRRELEVLALLGQGLGIRDIAKHLHRSPKTIEKHRAAIGEKLDARDRAHIIQIALRAGLTLSDAPRKRI